MGLLSSLFGKRKPTPQASAEEASLGWQAIDDAVAAAYPGQEPRHLANAGVRWMHDISGTANPLDGVHVLDGSQFWHYVGLGLTELYGKDSSDEKVSGLGYELTMRVEKPVDGGDNMPPIWPVDLLNGLGRPAMLGDLVYASGHTVKTGPLGKTGSAAAYVGVIFCDDAAFPTIDTPYGRVSFLQVVPVQADELARAQNGRGMAVVAELRQANPDLAFRGEI